MLAWNRTFGETRVGAPPLWGGEFIETGGGGRAGQQFKFAACEGGEEGRAMLGDSIASCASADSAYWSSVGGEAEFRGLNERRNEEATRGETTACAATADGRLALSELSDCSALRDAWAAWSGGVVAASFERWCRTMDRVNESEEGEEVEREGEAIEDAGGYREKIERKKERNGRRKERRREGRMQRKWWRALKPDQHEHFAYCAKALVSEQASESEVTAIINDIVADDIEQLGLTEYVACKARKLEKRDSIIIYGGRSCP